MFRLLAVTLCNAVRLLVGPVRWILWKRWMGRCRWVKVHVGSGFDAIAGRTPPLSSLFRGTPRELSLWELRQLVDRVCSEGRVEGVFVELKPLSCGWSTAVQLADALSALAKHKRVVVSAPHGGGTLDLVVALSGTELWVSPVATYAPVGSRVGQLHVKRLLERLGVDVQVFAVGKYKSAADGLRRDGMTEESREQFGRIVSQRQSRLTQALAEGSSPLGHAGGLISAQDLVEAGLAAGASYVSKLEDVLGAAETRCARADQFLRRVRFRWFRPWRRSKQVAVYPITGAIGAAHTPRTARWIRQLRSLGDNGRVAGVVLHVDSPGGSATGSDHLHHVVAQLATKKPVWVCFGDVAASGGYYVSAAATEVFCHPFCLTGSIGVISVRPHGAELLRRLGIRSESVEGSPGAGLFDVSRPASEAEQKILMASAERFYDRFVQVVCEGRHLERERVEALAQGRVWTGEDALSHRLATQRGGLWDATEGLKASCGAGDVVFVQESWMESLRRSLPLGMGSHGRGLPLWRVLHEGLCTGSPVAVDLTVANDVPSSMHPFT